MPNDCGRNWKQLRFLQEINQALCCVSATKTKAGGSRICFAIAWWANRSASRRAFVEGDRGGRLGRSIGAEVKKAFFGLAERGLGRGSGPVAQIAAVQVDERGLDAAIGQT